MTALDNALSEARKDESKSSEFYNLFLNSELCLPLLELPDEADPRSIAPVLIESGGSKYLMLFDEAERLGNWANREIPFAQVSGHAILTMMDPEVLFVLNVGTDFVHEFAAEEIAWLRSVVEAEPESGEAVH